MDFTWPDDLVTLRDEVDEFVAAHVSERRRCEDARLVGFDAEFDRALGRRGWIGMTWPTRWGGGGRSPLERFVVVERLLELGAPVAGSWFPDRQIGPVVLQFGTDEQRRRFLPDIIDGTARWCLGMSEPDAGSDVASIRTRAVRAGNEFIVNGTKVWTSGAQHARWCYLICRTDVAAPPHRGLSELIVDMTSAGIEVRPIRDASGDAHFNEVRFTEVRVPAANLVGGLNESFGQTMRQLEHERGGIDRLVSNRRRFLDVRGAMAPPDALLRAEAARLEGGYRIGRLMVLRNVVGQAPYPGYSAVTKTWCTEFEQRVASFVGRAFVTDPDLAARVDRNIVYAPAYTITGGTTQILRNIIGERALGLPR